MLSGLAEIIWLNIILSGDNAVVIGLAAAGLAPQLRSRAVLFGIIAAAILRIIFSIFATMLLSLWWIDIVGGLALLYIAWTFLKELRSEPVHEAGAASPPAEKTLGQALWQIIIADVSMSLDNVLAVAAVARSNLTLLMIGLGISIVMMGLLGGLLAKLLERFRIIAYIGVVLIVWIGLQLLWEGLIMANAALQLGLPVPGSRIEGSTACPGSYPGRHGPHGRLRRAAKPGGAGPGRPPRPAGAGGGPGPAADGGSRVRTGNNHQFRGPAARLRQCGGIHHPRARRLAGAGGGGIGHALRPRAAGPAGECPGGGRDARAGRGGARSHRAAPGRTLAEIARRNLLLPDGGSMTCADLSGSFGRTAVEQQVCAGTAAGRFLRVHVTMPRRNSGVADADDFTRAIAAAARRASAAASPAP
ncbi:YjbE family putative metal transport protein [Pseudoroseomonas wenyumeiae]